MRGEGQGDRVIGGTHQTFVGFRSLSVALILYDVLLSNLPVCVCVCIYLSVCLSISVCGGDIKSRIGLASRRQIGLG